MNFFIQFNKLLFLTNEKLTKISLVVVFLIITSLIDITGITLLGIFISFLLGNTIFDSLPFFGNLLIKFDLNSDNFILYSCIILFLFFFVKTTSSLIIQYFIIKFSHKKMADLRMHLVESYKSMNYYNYIKRNSSELIAAVSNHIKNYGSLLQVSLQFVADIFIIIFIAILLFTVNWVVFSTILIILSTFLYLYKIFFLNKAYIYGFEVNEGFKKLYQNINEMFIGFKEIKILNKFNNFQNNIKTASYNIVDAEVKKTFIETAPRHILEFFVVLIVLLLIFLSFLFYGKIEQVVTTLSFFVAAFLRVAPMVYQFTRYISTLKYTKNSIDILFNDYKKIDNNTNKNLIGNDNFDFDEINIKDLDFKYDESKNNVLSNVNLKFKKGQAIGIVGSSGSGKTTLVDLILGLLNYNKGSFSIDKKDIKSFQNIEIWRNLFYYLPQEVFIINDTLKKNVALGIDENDIDDDKVESSLKKANLEEFKNKLSNGINTVIGERGINISGGQKQRIAIARSFYFDKKIIIFDEGTSSLDQKTENKIIDELYQLKGEKTLIIISHSKNTIKNCDIIFNIEENYET